MANKYITLDGLKAFTNKLKNGGLGSLTLNDNNANNKPALIFQRGTLSDTAVDWQLIDDAGFLKFQNRNQDNTWMDVLSLSPQGSKSITVTSPYSIYATNFNGALKGNADTATSAKYIKYDQTQQSGGDANLCAVTHQEFKSYLVNKNISNLFPASDNNNTLTWIWTGINSGVGDGHQLGFSSNGRLYHRARRGTTFSKWGHMQEYIETSYADLKTLRDNSKLIPGAKYRITDYITTTSQENTVSAGHQFDIIVEALSKSKLSENAKATHHSGDTYFTNSKLSAWELKYCLDNDTDRFGWANNNNIVDIKPELVSGNTFITRFQPEYYILIDGANRDFNYGDNKDSDYFIEYGREIDPDGNENLCIYKNNINGGDDWGENDTDYIDKFFYCGTEELDGITYDMWRKAEYDSWTSPRVENTDSSLYILTNIITTQLGRGVIYYMKDERGNECPYDFKNIMFIRYKLNAPTVGGYSYDWQNRMSENINKMFEDNRLSYLWHGMSGEDDQYWEDEMSEVISSPTGEKKAFFTFSNVIDDVVTDKSNTFNCYGNTIKENYQGSFLTLNNIVFFSTDVNIRCYSNSFGNNCYYNSFGNDCSSNSFGNNYGSNSFGNSCYFNSFGDSCNSNSFGNDYYSNSFGNNCYYNSFGNDCSSNSFGNSCSSNSFGNSCSSNSFGNSCYSNSFGNNCYSNSFGNNCSDNKLSATNSAQSTYNEFGKYCRSNDIIGNFNSISDNSIGNIIDGNYNLLKCVCVINTISGTNNTLLDGCSKNNITGDHNNIGDNSQNNIINGSLNILEQQCNSNEIGGSRNHIFNGSFSNTISGSYDVQIGTLTKGATITDSSYIELGCSCYMPEGFLSNEVLYYGSPGNFYPLQYASPAKYVNISDSKNIKIGNNCGYLTISECDNINIGNDFNASIGDHGFASNIWGDYDSSADLPSSGVLRNVVIQKINTNLDELEPKIKNTSYMTIGNGCSYIKVDSVRVGAPSSSIVVSDNSHNLSFDRNHNITIFGPASDYDYNSKGSGIFLGTAKLHS